MSPIFENPTSREEGIFKDPTCATAEELELLKDLTIEIKQAYHLCLLANWMALAPDCPQERRAELRKQMADMIRRHRDYGMKEVVEAFGGNFSVFGE